MQLISYNIDENGINTLSLPSHVFIETRVVFFLCSPFEHLKLLSDSSITVSIENILPLFPIIPLLQETLPVLDSFMAQFLRRWNGVDYRPQILTLLALMPPRPYEGTLPTTHNAD